MIELDHAVLNGHLHLWGYEVAIYLFLGGLAAGLLVFAAAVELTGRRGAYAPAIRVAALAAPALVAVGLLFLWLDLGSTWSPYWLYTTLRPASPMSWGAWVLLAVLVTSGLAALPFLPHLPARVAAPVERLAARAVAWRRALAAAPAAARQAHDWMQKPVVEAAEKMLATMPADYYQIEPAAASRLLETAQPFVLDVREPAEVQAERIPGSVSIPMREIPKNLGKLPENKNAPIVTYCKVGYRGGLAMDTLRMLGYTNARSLKGGLDAWKTAGLPVTK